MLVVGCGGNTEAADPEILTNESAPTRPAMASTTFTTSVKITVSATTSIARPVPMPVPQEPPDPHGIEPVVELGSIEIPRMGLNKPFFEGVTLGTLARGPGHWPGRQCLGNVYSVCVPPGWLHEGADRGATGAAAGAEPDCYTLSCNETTIRSVSEPTGWHANRVAVYAAV